jgi:hypothetical protein
MSFLSGIPGVLKVALPLAVGAALAGAIAWGASGGAGGGGAPEAPAASAPTPKPEKTPGPPWDLGRPDCPRGWEVWNDPDGYFSACYPPGLLKGAPFRNAGEGTNFYIAAAPGLKPDGNVNVGDQANRFSLAANWIPRFVGAVGFPSVNTCPGYGLGDTPAQFVQIQVGNRFGAACTATGHILEMIPRVSTTSLEILVAIAPDGSGSEGYVAIGITYSGPDFTGTFNRVRQILGTFIFR